MTHTLSVSGLAVVPLRDLLQHLHSTDTGLSASDAASILKTAGPNEVESAKPKSLLSAIVERFSNQIRNLTRRKAPVQLREVWRQYPLPIRWS
jgi:hypothetical protein